jgi:hypothetical protein
MSVSYVFREVSELSERNTVKVKVKQSRYRPGVAQRVPVKAPRFHDNGTGWW